MAVARTAPTPGRACSRSAVRSRPMAGSRSARSSTSARETSPAANADLTSARSCRARSAFARASARSSVLSCRKGCDLLVVNEVGHGLVFGQDETEVTVLSAAGDPPITRTGTKAEAAGAVLQALAGVLARRGADPAPGR